MRTPHLHEILERTSVVQTRLSPAARCSAALRRVTHLTWARIAFRAQVPRSLPLPADLVVVASGLVELALEAFTARRTPCSRS